MENEPIDRRWHPAGNALRRHQIPRSPRSGGHRSGAGTHAAAVFTRNAFCAAPVDGGAGPSGRCPPRYLLINTGNANAGTGRQGLGAMPKQLSRPGRIGPAADRNKCCRFPPE
jgi:hypothetical protein